jgi:hypothetical protein
MFSRRLMLALPAMAFVRPAMADQPDDLALVLAICWQARGVNFTPAAVRMRIGSARGKAALLAVAGATTSTDGDGEETAVEIVWEAGQPQLPTEHLMHRDLAQGLPLLLIDRRGQPWLLHALANGIARVTKPADVATDLPLAAAALIARPVIAGA